MEKITRVTHLPRDLDSMVIGMSEATQVATSDVIRECVHIAQNEPIVRRELLRRLDEVKQRRREQEAANRGYEARLDSYTRQHARTHPIR